MSKLGVATAKMTFLEHLDELRRRIIISLLAVAIAFALCFTFATAHLRLPNAPPALGLATGGRAHSNGGSEIFLLY